MSRAMKLIAPFLLGFLFSLGLGISGMTEPAKVIGFLDVLGHWDPSLIFVMVGAIITHTLLFRLVLKRKSPLFSKEFFLPKKNIIDRKLILGSALFGTGWGISGLCPGPGIASLSSAQPYILIFVAAFIVGTLASRKFFA